MAYFLVMGGLALSVCFTLGWVLVRGSRWVIGRVRGTRPRSGRGTARRASAKKAAAPARGARAARKTAPDKGPAAPSRLSRGLAKLHSAVPLALLMLLLYGGSRLAEYGMTRRPLAPPGEFHHLVNGLGWAAAGLLTLAALSLLAGWRCRR